MKVKITASNTSFVSVGDITEVITNHDGTQVMWSDFVKDMSESLGVNSYGESNTKNYLKCMTNKHCVFIPTSEYTEQCRS